MKKIKKEVYFNNIGVNLSFCGVFSEKADALLVPQHQNGISLMGISAAVVHSVERQAIIDFQKIVAKKKTLSYDEAFAFPCKGNVYRYLIQFPVLGASADITSFAIMFALRKADDMALKKVIITAVNTGYSGSLTDEEAANATFKAIDDFSRIAHSVNKISLNIYNNATYLTYKKCLARVI